MNADQIADIFSAQVMPCTHRDITVSHPSLRLGESFAHCYDCGAKLPFDACDPVLVVASMHNHYGPCDELCSRAGCTCPCTAKEDAR